MRADRTISVGIGGDGRVGLVFEVPGETRTTVDMPWRDAAQLMSGLTAAVLLLARREGLSDGELDAVMTSIQDQSAAEIMARLRAVR